MLHTDNRLDMYKSVHKGLRAFMSDVLLAAGRMDITEKSEVTEVLGQIRELLDVCRGHLFLENQFVHPAMEARRPGSAGDTAGDHVRQEELVERLESEIRSVQCTTGESQIQSASKLYRSLAEFVAENYQHMEIEEKHNNAVLWEAYTDAELNEIHRALLRAIPPPKMMQNLRWMLPYMTPAERAALLSELRPGVPPTVFEQILSLVKKHVDLKAWTKLETALAVS